MEKEKAMMKEDRRIKRTKKMLKDSLASLLMEKDINLITVKELVDLADLNRSTFYLHYRDIYDMLTQIENDMIEEINHIESRYPVSVLKKSSKLFLIDIFKYTDENRTFCKMLLGSHGNMAFLEKIKKILENNCFHVITEGCSEKDLQKHQFFSTFAVSGCAGLLQNWLESDSKMTPGELAQVADDFIQNGFDILNKNSKE